MILNATFINSLENTIYETPNNGMGSRMGGKTTANLWNFCCYGYSDKLNFCFYDNFFLLQVDLQSNISYSSTLPGTLEKLIFTGIPEIMSFGCWRMGG